MLEVSEVELHVAVEPADRLVEIALIPRAALLERHEGVRVKLRHQVEDPALDVVHGPPIGEVHSVVRHRRLFELGEDAVDLLAHVGLSVVPTHANAVASDVHRVTDRTKRVDDTLRLRDQRGEPLGGDVGGQIVAQADEPARAHIDVRETFGERGDRTAISDERLEKPALLLESVVQLVLDGEVIAHLAHPFGESQDSLERRLSL